MQVGSGPAPQLQNTLLPCPRTPTCRSSILSRAPFCSGVSTGYASSSCKRQGQRGGMPAAAHAQAQHAAPCLQPLALPAGPQWPLSPSKCQTARGRRWPMGKSRVQHGRHHPQPRRGPAAPGPALTVCRLAMKGLVSSVVSLHAATNGPHAEFKGVSTAAARHAFTPAAPAALCFMAGRASPVLQVADVAGEVDDPVAEPVGVAVTSGQAVDVVAPP